jgi:hypothetical protein
LATIQEKFKHVVATIDKKLNDLTEQATEEVTLKEATIVPKFEVAKAIAQ